MKDCSVVHVIQGVFYVQKEHDRETLCSALGCQETLQLTVPYTAVVVYYGLAIKVTMAPIHSWLRTVGRSPLRYALMAAQGSGEGHICRVLVESCPYPRSSAEAVPLRTLPEYHNQPGS